MKLELVSEFELSPRFENVKSYYKKAVVREYNDNGHDQFCLYSYGTCVCVKEDGNFYRLGDDDLYTATTLRHIKEFMQQLNGERLNKAKILALPVWGED